MKRKNGLWAALDREMVRKGWTMGQLANHAGVSRQTLYNIQWGESVSTSTLQKIADALGIPLAVLFV